MIGAVALGAHYALGLGAPETGVASPSGSTVRPTSIVSPSTASNPTGGRSTIRVAAAYPDVTVAPGSKLCGRFGSGPYDKVGTYNESTSCEFALNVRRAYLAAGPGGADRLVSAFSPVTGKTYVMTCTGAQPVRCTGGIAARVVIFGGDFTIAG